MSRRDNEKYAVSPRKFCTTFHLSLFECIDIQRFEFGFAKFSMIDEWHWPQVDQFAIITENFGYEMQQYILYVRALIPSGFIWYPKTDTEFWGRHCSLEVTFLGGFR